MGQNQSERAKNQKLRQNKTAECQVFKITRLSFFINYFYQVISIRHAPCTSCCVGSLGKVVSNKNITLFCEWAIFI